MARNVISAIAIMILIVFSFIIAAPITFLSVGLSSYGKINKFLTYKYAPISPPYLDKLNLYVAVGNIEIQYIDPPVDYDAKIDVSIEMIGPNLVGKNYSDYFNIGWQHTGGLVNFTMELKSSINQAEVLSLIKNVNIAVALKADVICDISVVVNIQGDVKITVPWGISVGNILTNVSKGDIQYDFSYCILEGNLTGIIQEIGNIELKTYNIEYSQNTTWALNTGSGDFLIEIFQYTDMNANVSGTISHDHGNIRFKYKDDNTDVGAYFTLYYNADDLSLRQAMNQVIGFNSIPSDEQDIFYLWSDDYPTKNNYNLLFNNSNGLYLVLDLYNS